MSEHTSSDDRLDELTAGLPREVAPLPDLWPAIRAELAPRSARAAQWSPRWRLVAAGLLALGHGRDSRLIIQALPKAVAR